MKCFFYLIILLAAGCTSTPSHKARPKPEAGAYITRHADDTAQHIPASRALTRPPYPWEKNGNSPHARITKEFFRCKGSSLNPPRIVEEQGQTSRFYDCGGSEKHSLPLRDGKEFVYAILLDLMNYIQAETGKRVIITSGHRCPEHNAYCDPSKANDSSKHMVGGEVSFYVQGLENNPEKVIETIQRFYKDSKFERYTKGDSNVSTAPWFNKEIFIKLFKKNEGRNFDNRHPYPYISIQVRHDRETNTPVIYDWNRAHKNFLRK